MIPFVRFWIWISAFASLAGWTLSALGQLNRTGYVVAFALFAVFVFWQRQQLGFAAGTGQGRLRKFRRRFRRRWPLGFAVLILLTWVGAMIHAPTHHTALTYHVPRVLHWLAADGWYWIHSPVVRMNYSGCDFEWCFAPMVLFSGTYRYLFLFNIVSILLLPGLMFSLLTRLGVSGRVAWQWMWLFPCGYLFLLQAGSAGNDLFVMPFAVAAMVFALQAWQTRQPRDLLYSCLAMGLTIGVKPAGLPLLLPWTVLVFGILPVLRKAMVATILVAALAALVSFLPLAILNQIHCGDWMGTAIEPSVLKMTRPIVGITGNVFQLLVHNLAPPLFPLAGWWNQHLPAFLPKVWLDNFQSGFCFLGELPTEDWPGIGFGVSWLLIISGVAAWWLHRRGNLTNSRRSILPPLVLKLVLFTPWISLLFFCSQSAMNTPARLVSVYYPLLLPSLLVGVGHLAVIRRRWWQVLAGATFALALIVMILSVDRPLWPATTVLTNLAASHPDSRLVSRALNVYTVYASRSDPLAAMREMLPPRLAVVGFVGTADDSDISLWQPLGSRRVEHFFIKETADDFRKRGVEYVVVSGFHLHQQNLTFAEWQARTEAEPVGQITVTEKVSDGPQIWYLVRIKPTADAKPSLKP
jgi:hypothetical protein